MKKVTGAYHALIHTRAAVLAALVVALTVVALGAPGASANVCVPISQVNPLCPIDTVQGIANEFGEYTLALGTTYTTMSEDGSTSDASYDVDMPAEIVSGAAGVVVDENSQGQVVDCLYTIHNVKTTITLSLSTTSSPCGGANRNERCYSSTTTVTAQYPVTHKVAWSARLYKTWCGIPGIKITSQDASTDTTIGTCWSGPQFPAHSTRRFTKTHSETTMTGTFSFQCGFAYKQMNLNAGVEFWSNGSRKHFNKTST